MPYLLDNFNYLDTTTDSATIVTLCMVEPILKVKPRWYQYRLPLWAIAFVVITAFAVGVWWQSSPYSTSAVTIKGSPAAATSTVSGSRDVPSYLAKDVQFALFWDVWKLVRDRYYEQDIPETQLFYGALRGIVASLGDPHSVFFTPDDNEEFADELKGNFEGIGAEINVQNGQLIIVTPLPDTPAEKAGLKPKDLILSINGTSTVGMTVGEAVSHIRGPQGSTVTLKIARPGAAARDITIKREAITVKSVSWVYLDNNQIAHVTVRQFNEDTIGLLDKAAAEFATKPVKSVIIDLRNNPGGYLDSAIAVSGLWQRDAVAVKERLRDGTEHEYRTDRQPTLGNFKTIVLVNAGSASASEIVAGALKDWGKATIVGTVTFGKGSVQELLPLGDGSAVKLTIAKWFTPKGTTIDGTGITPDVVIDLTEADHNADRDPQLDKALEILRK